MQEIRYPNSGGVSGTVGMPTKRCPKNNQYPEDRNGDEIKEEDMQDIEINSSDEESEDIYSTDSSVFDSDEERDFKEQFCCFLYLLALGLMLAVFFLSYCLVGINFLKDFKVITSLPMGNLFTLLFDIVLCVSFVAVAAKFAVEASGKEICIKPFCTHKQDLLEQRFPRFASD